MKNKIERLTDHYERIIFLNSIYHYAQSGNPKIDKFYKLLLQIKTQTITQRNKFFNPILKPVQQLKNK